MAGIINIKEDDKTIRVYGLSNKVFDLMKLNNETFTSITMKFSNTNDGKRVTINDIKKILIDLDEMTVIHKDDLEELLSPFLTELNVSLDDIINHGSGEDFKDTFRLNCLIEKVSYGEMDLEKFRKDFDKFLEESGYVYSKWNNPCL